MSDYNYGFNGKVPPGIQITDNVVLAINATQGMTVLQTMSWFANQVGNNKPMDYKQLDSSYADFGNYNYAIVGTALGIPRNVLLSGAGGAQLTSNYGDMGSSYVKYAWSLLDYGTASALGIFTPDYINMHGLYDNAEDRVMIRDGLDAAKPLENQGLYNKLLNDTDNKFDNVKSYLHINDNLYNSLNPENQQIVAAMWNETTNGTTITLEDGQTIYLTSTSLEGLGNVISGTRESSNGVTETTNSYFTGVDGTLLGNIKGYDPANGDTTLQMLQNTTSTLLEAFQGSITQSTLIAAGVATSPFAYKDSLFGDYGFYTQDDSSYGLMNETGYWDYAKGDFTSWTDGGNFANNYGFDTLGDNYAYLNGFDNYGGCVA
jgi:hypothetical protein